MAETDMKARPAEDTGPPGLAAEMDATRTARPLGEQCEDACAILAGTTVAFLAIWLVVYTIWATSTYEEAEYSVAIATVSGLDPPPDRPVLYPEFNLAVHITRRGLVQRPCDESYTTLQVSYKGFTLASAAAPQICNIISGDDAKEGRTVVARGTRVWLPGPTFDSLAADVRRAAGVFDVTLTMPGYMVLTKDDGLVVSCMGRAIGDDDGSGLCDVSALHQRHAG